LHILHVKQLKKNVLELSINDLSLDKTSVFPSRNMNINV